MSRQPVTCLFCPSKTHKKWRESTSLYGSHTKSTWRCERVVIALELPHQIRRDLADRANPKQREIAIDLGLEQRDRALHAGFAAGDRSIEERAADPDEMRAERQGLDHIGAAADAAIHHDRHALCLSRDL